MVEWVADHEGLVAALFALSTALFFASLLGLPILIVRIPADYFTRKTPPPSSWRGRHPAVRAAILVVKNVLGVLFVLAGIAMLFLPGQGILAILIGITLLNFPGKRALELRIARSRPVLRAINWIRTRSHRPPLQVPHEAER
jgi:hypothetical protein